MSGSGHKTFVDGDVLTAAEVNGYLMDQAVIYYATSTARDLDTPYEGKIVYLADSNKMQFYTGTAWIDVQDTQIFNNKGDLVVGTGADTRLRLAVGSNEQRLVADSGETTGLKYVADTTNYAIGAKGDLLVGTAADTVTNLAVGTNGYVLTADSAETSGLKWAAAAGGGKVLQVVSGTDSTSTVNTTTSYVDTGLTATITPSSASNKVLVIVSDLASVYTTSSAVYISGAIRLMRDATSIIEQTTPDGTIRVGNYSTNGTNGFTASLVHMAILDSPATTSAVTYKTQQRVVAGTGVAAQLDGYDASIILMEIEA